MVDIVLVGIGGYGGNYVNELLDKRSDDCRIVGVVDPFATNCARLSELLELGVEVYDDLDTFYQDHEADLAVVSSPIALHCRQTCKCLEHDTNVLCEKPLAGSVEDGMAMAKAEERSDGFVAIGYQWSFASGMQELKQDIIAGLYGRAVRLKTYAAWPRRKSYYKRNNWAGKIRAADGSWVLDSPAHNATAHYLHNMFYLLGKTINSSARPADVTAELYRAKDIENYDTIAMRVKTEDDVEILFYSTHAVSELVGPVIKYEFENGMVEVNIDCEIVGRFADGTIKEYVNSSDVGMKKMWDCIEAVRSGGDIVCGIDAALSQLLCIDMAQGSTSGITDFPSSMVKVDLEGGIDADDTLTWVVGLQENLRKCYECNLLPSELPEVKNGPLSSVFGLR